MSEQRMNDKPQDVSTTKGWCEHIHENSCSLSARKNTCEHNQRLVRTHVKEHNISGVNIQVNIRHYKRDTIKV